MAPGASVLTPPAGTGESEIPQAPGAGTGATPEASGSPATSPTPIAIPSTNLVGGGSDAYNPNAAQPYSAPVATPVTPMVPAANALGPEPEANGAVNQAGAIAYAVSKGLHGYMKGLAVRQINQGIQLQKQSVGLQQNLDTASQQLYALAKAGTDQNSPQYQAALNQVTAAHQAQLDFMKQHVAGEQIDKKTGQLKPQEGSIASRLFQTQDPAAIPLAAYQAAEKLGPPVLHQIAPFQTPQYQAYAKTQAQTAALQQQAALGQAQEDVEHRQLEHRYNQLSSIIGRDLTPEEEQEKGSIATRLGKAGAGIALAKDQLATMILADPTKTPEEKTKQLVLLGSKSAAGMMLKQPQLGTKGFMQQKYAESIGIDPSKLTAADLAYIDKVDSWNKLHTISTSSQHLVPGVDSHGRAGMIPMTTISTRGVPGAPQPPAGRPFIDSIGAVPTEEAAGAAANPILPANATPAAIASAGRAHSNALAAGATASQALKVARIAAKRTQGSATSDEPPGFIPTGAPRKQTPDETKVYNDENTTGEALTTAEKAAQLKDKAAGDKALGAAFARSQVGGRLSNFDIQRFNNLGSARLRLEGGIAQSVDGTMTDEQRNMILDNMRIGYQTKHTLAEHYRNGDAGVGQRSSEVGGKGAGGGGGKAPSADDLEDLFQKAKAH